MRLHSFYSRFSHRQMSVNPPTASPGLSNASLGLYIHWPFCRHKCPYCDFNSHVSTIHDNAAFGAALCQEMTHMAALLPDRRALTSLFFGGGTPSLMPPNVVGKIISHAEKTFGSAPAIEITTEAKFTCLLGNCLNALVVTCGCTHHANTWQCASKSIRQQVVRTP